MDTMDTMDAMDTIDTVERTKKGKVSWIVAASARVCATDPRPTSGRRPKKERPTKVTMRHGGKERAAPIMMRGAGQDPASAASGLFGPLPKTRPFMQPSSFSSFPD